MRRSRKRSNPKNYILSALWFGWWIPHRIKTASEWAEKRRKMTKFDSPDSGMPWNPAKVPYAKYIMDLFSLPFLRKLVLKWATQTCKTNLALNCLGFTMDEVGGPCMVVYPTGDTKKRASRTRIDPMINACDSLRAKKTHQWTVDEKHFLGGIIYIASSQSGSELSSAPVEFAWGDELKDWPAYTSQGKGGDPVKYLSDRQKQFQYTKKLLLVSSSSLEDAPISKHHRSCEYQICLYVPCPHCKGLFEFEFDRKYFKFGKDRWPEKYQDLESTDPAYWRLAKKYTYYKCPHCEGEIIDRHKPKMLFNGKWLDKNQNKIPEDAESVGSELSSIYSPDLKFGDISHEFLECKDDPEKYMNFVTGWLNKDWKVKAQDLASKDILARKCDVPALTVPDGAIALTAGIDVQKHGFYYTVWAWSLDLESWLIDYGFMVTWQDVDALIFKAQFQTINDDAPMMIWRAAIDTGGGKYEEEWSKTEEIYTWLRGNSRGRIFGVKGISKPHPSKIHHSVIDKMPGKNGAVIPGGIVLFMLDTDKLKEDFFWRMSNSDTDPQPMHFHADTGEDFAKHVLSEEKRRKKDGSWEWVQVSKDNHWLDCSLYAHACADPQWMGGVKVLGRRPVRKPPPKQQSNGFLGKSQRSGWLR